MVRVGDFCRVDFAVCIDGETVRLANIREENASLCISANLIIIYLPDSSISEVFQAALSPWFRSNQQTYETVSAKKAQVCLRAQSGDQWLSAMRSALLICLVVFGRKEGNLDSLSLNDFFNAQKGRTTGLQNL